MAFSGMINVKTGQLTLGGQFDAYKRGQLERNIQNIDFYKDSTYVIPENGILTMEQINVAYLYLNTKINSLICLQTDTLYKINVIDIDMRETNLKDGTISLVMSLSGGFGTINGNYFPFASTDWWYWGFDYGKCGDYQGQSVGLDATDVLETKFNHPLIVPDPGFFTNVISTTAFPWEYSASNNPGPSSYYMMFYYSSPTPIPPPCLSPEELNFYLSTFDYIKADKRPSASLVFCNVDVIYDVIVNMTPDNGFHKYELYYGNFVPRSEE